MIPVKSLLGINISVGNIGPFMLCYILSAVSRWFMWDTVDDLEFEQTAGNCSADTQSSKW